MGDSAVGTLTTSVGDSSVGSSLFVTGDSAVGTTSSALGDSEAGTPLFLTGDSEVGTTSSAVADSAVDTPSFTATPYSNVGRRRKKMIVVGIGQISLCCFQI